MFKQDEGILYRYAKGEKKIGKITPKTHKNN